MGPAPGAAEVATNVVDTRPAPLSEGAGKALGTVLRRLLDSSRDVSRREASAKRPRGLGLVLGDDDEVAKAAADDLAERTKEREGQRAKNRFESMSRVVPDAATGAATERGLKETATRGVVALFNAVAKAQKANAAKEDAKSKRGKDDEPVSREKFASMIQARIRKRDDDSESNSNEDEPKAKWMKADFATRNSGKLKDWNRDVAADSSEDDEIGNATHDIEDTDEDDRDSSSGSEHGKRDVDDSSSGLDEKADASDDDESSSD